MELLNRNALLSGWTGMAFSGDSRQIILEQPIVDAVPVVRCKDCKFRDGTPGQPNILCGQMKENDFCSYGEKKT